MPCWLNVLKVNIRKLDHVEKHFKAEVETTFYAGHQEQSKGMIGGGMNAFGQALRQVLFTF